MKKIISTLALALGIIFFAAAQEKVQLTGSVKSDNGVQIEKATVVIKDVVNKTETPVQVNQNGTYSTTVKKGKYVVKFAAPGYASKSVIALVMGDTEVDMNLVKIKNSKTSRL